MGNNNCRRIPLPSSGFCDFEICSSLQFWHTAATRLASIFPCSFSISLIAAFCPSLHTRKDGCSKNPTGNTLSPFITQFKSSDRSNVNGKPLRSCHVTAIFSIITAERGDAAAMSGNLPLFTEVLVLYRRRSHHNKWSK